MSTPHDGATDSASALYETDRVFEPPNVEKLIVTSYYQLQRWSVLQVITGYYTRIVRTIREL
jgi:hypothetical protein